TMTKQQPKPNLNTYTTLFRSKESGSQLKKRLSENIPNIDEDTPYVVFNRDAEKEFRTGKVYFCPPVIYDQDGNKLVWYEDADGRSEEHTSELQSRENIVYRPL